MAYDKKSFILGLTTGLATRGVLRNPAKEEPVLPFQVLAQNKLYYRLYGDDITVDFGDGTVITDSYPLAQFDTSVLNHTFPNTQEYTVTFTGGIKSIAFYNDDGTFLKNNTGLLEVLTPIPPLSHMPRYLFTMCVNLRSVPGDLFRHNTTILDVNRYFYNDKSLTSIPLSLFEPTQNISNFKECFRGCTGLTGNAPVIWTRDNVTSYSQCFRNCTGLSNYADIPSDWK